MANENAAIWQVQDSADNGNETGASPAAEIVNFNPTPQLASGGYIFNTEATMRNSVPEVPSIAENNNQIQDMGLDGVDIVITGRIVDADSDDDVASLIRWMKESKKATGYTKGRFGLRLDDFPQFNVNPTSTYGYVLADVKFVRDGEIKNKVGIVLTLRLGGDLDSAI